MKINGMHNKYVNINIQRSNEKQRMETAENKIKKENSVNIEISDSAKALAEKINGSNDVKYSEKVERIRKSILEGTYKVSSEELADKLIKTMEEQKGSDK